MRSRYKSSGVVENKREREGEKEGRKEKSENAPRRCATRVFRVRWILSQIEWVVQKEYFVEKNVAMQPFRELVKVATLRVK